jgi:thymidylate kinase
MIYQGESNGIGRGLLSDLAFASRMRLRPDYVFWINTPPELAAERIAERGEILESGYKKRLEKLHEAYQEYFRTDGTPYDFFTALDGTKSISDLTTEVIEILKSISTK